MHAIEGLRGAAMVTRAGQVRLEVAGGLADAEAGVKCTPQTRFQLCSVSKQLAAAAAMLLAARTAPGWPGHQRRLDDVRRLRSEGETPA